MNASRVLTSTEHAARPHRAKLRRQSASACVCFRGDTLSSKHLASHHKCSESLLLVTGPYLITSVETNEGTCPSVKQRAVGKEIFILVTRPGATSLFVGRKSVQGSSRSWRLSPQQNPSSQPIATMAGIRNDLDRLKSTNATISDASPFRTACRNIIAACRNSPLSLANYCREGTVPVLASSLIQVRWFAERIAAARFSHIQPACAAVLCDIISASASAEPAWRAHACSFPRSCR